jgi:DHA2 family multidrug resistance protein-like MFS transporter
MAAGLVLAAIGFGMFSQVSSTSGLAIVIAGSVAFSLGLAPLFTLATDLVVGSASPERAGAASAISETSSELGGALGIAVFGSIGVAIYRNALALPASLDLPAEAAEAARSTLGAAVTIAEHLPDEVGLVVVNAAREAFVTSVQLTAVLSAVGALGIALLVLVLLRNIAAAEAEPQEVQSAETSEPVLMAA